MLTFYFLVGLYTWVFQGNIFEYGFAELTIFFDLTPWFFMFFIPALCMRLYSEEFESSTYQLLRALPISSSTIYFSKVLSVFFIILITLLPTLLFPISVGLLGSPTFNIDYAVVLGGYLALLLLAFTFITLSTLASALSNKQSLSFVLGVFLIFICWQGPQEIKNFLGLDMNFNSLFFHFENLSRGLIDLSSICFFLGFSILISGFVLIRMKYKFLG